MNIEYLSRAQWGANQSLPRLGWSVPPAARIEVFIHHTVVIDPDATPNVWETMAEVRAKMQQIQVIRPDLGLDVPYSYVAFFMPGKIVICEGRGAGRTGAHTIGHNTSAIGLALQGNFQLPTFGLEAYLPAVGEWLHRLKVTALPNLASKHPAGRDCYGHRDVSQTACPGSYVYDRLNLVKLEAPEEDDMPIADTPDDWLVPDETRSLIRSTQHLNRRVEQVAESVGRVHKDLGDEDKLLAARIAALEAQTGDGSHSH